ncbi:DUF4258 domain-containing protein [Robertkochia marina]|uniref:DUF4258 domain-containing protein n=1 Tax=Robertkochia marina TaxID=1227945 RepID=A0A4S3M185_9FLAO|nr:DUF4258 domain-containing protein [Robertkochia marina]THD67948.1 DUF4258 domain-containing protein [Robertkochia marina]TRZ41554.1 DUF4258 domain-containing protein [Robertkochia marina]
MSLLKKIGFYLIGFSIGLIFLTFFLKGKNTEICYFPNCRVLKDIRSKDLTYSDQIQTLINNKTLTPEQIQTVLRDGDINFKESETEGAPCKTYLIEGDINEKTIELRVKNCDGYAEVIAIEELAD